MLARDALHKVSAVEELPNSELKEIVNALLQCISPEEIEVIVGKYSDAIAQQGYTKIYIAKLSKREEIVACLLKQYYVYGIASEIQQFVSGMNSIGKFGDTVMSNVSLFELLLSNKRPKLTCNKFEELYTIDFSCQGSNKRSKEEDVIYCFELFLTDLEDGQVNQLSLEELLIFIIGSDVVQHLG